MNYPVRVTDENLAAIIERLRTGGDDEAADALVLLDAEAAEVVSSAPPAPVSIPSTVTAPATHHTRLEAALGAIQKPATPEAVLEVARGVLPSAQFGQFSAWMKANGAALVGRLNG